MAADPEKTRQRHARYNASAKGQARNKRYEEAHPERRNRSRTGFVARDAMTRQQQGLP